MNSGMLIFAFGVAGLAAAAAIVAPTRHAPSAEERPASAPPIATREARPPNVAPVGQGMVSNSTSSGPVAVRMWPPPPNPPIVAIPRIPGPADMMISQGVDRPPLTLRSFPSNEACDEALPRARYRYPHAFCVSTTPPPPPPQHGFLIEVETATNQWIGLETYPSMAECERVLAARAPKPGIQSACADRLH